MLFISVYSAEIATPKLRGRLTVLTSMAIAVGILMIYILGYIFPVIELQCRIAHFAKCFLIDFHPFHVCKERLALRQRNCSCILCVHVDSRLLHSRVPHVADISRPDRRRSQSPRNDSGDWVQWYGGELFFIFSN